MPIPRQLADRDLAYNAIHKDWAGFISDYDTSRRIEVLIRDFLGPFDWSDKSVLEVGTGLGFFTGAIRELGPAKFLTVDIAPNLIENIRNKYPGIDARVADVLALSRQLTDTYDLIICSEVIEHTPDPRVAFMQLASCLKKGGVLVLSTPNRRWYWLLLLAKALGLRNEYKGYENWSSPHELLKWCETASLKVLRQEGVHVAPWQMMIKSWLRKADMALRGVSYELSINLAVMAQKTGP